MRVAGNDDVDAVGSGIELEFMDVVQDVDRAPAELDRFGGGIACRPIGGVDIPLDRNHGRDAAQAADDLRPTDVTGVDDVRHAGEALLSLGTQEAVRV